MNLLDPQHLLHSLKRSLGEPPGSINYTGLYKDVPVTLDLITYDPQTYTRNHLTSAQDLAETQAIQWLNVTGLHQMTLIEDIGKRYEIHHMDLEDIVHVSQRSKIDLKNGYLFGIFKMLYLQEEKTIREHVSVIMVDQVLITFQETPGDVFEPIRERIQNNAGRIRNQGVQYLLYALIDSIVDGYFVIMNKVMTDFNEIETQLFEEGSTDLKGIYKLKKELLYLKNAATPLKDVMQGFIKIEEVHELRDIKPYYGDVMDHLHQLNENISTYREMVNSLYEMQNANVNDDISKVMMTLTVFSAIFIPLSFLAGVFGMNFKDFPLLDYPNAFNIFMGICGVIATGMLVFFKKNKWF